MEELQLARDFLFAERMAVDAVDPSEDEMIIEIKIDSLMVQRDRILLVKEANEMVAEVQASLATIDLIKRDEYVAEHDREFAKVLLQVSQKDWDKMGDELDDPIVPERLSLRSEEGLYQSSIVGEDSCLPLSSEHSTSGPPRVVVAPPRFIQTLSVPPSAACSSSRATEQCLICFESFPKDEMLSAERDADQPSSSSSDPHCKHLTCKECVRSYVLSQINSRKFPIKCILGSCKFLLPRWAVDMALEGMDNEAMAYCQMEVESTIDFKDRIYCPHKDCSALLIRKEDGDKEAVGPEICPYCTKAFCPRCRIAGWHQGFTCSDFQALPGHLKSAEDAAVLKLSSDKAWKKCPSCNMVVERSEGCNHVKCRCGTDFCYSCGLRYKSSAPTATNAHGTAACKCALFDVPDERPLGGNVIVDPPRLMHPPLQGEGARERRQAPPAGNRRVVRGGRKVSNTACWHSASIDGCPKGRSCWFRHVDDE